MSDLTPRLYRNPTAYGVLALSRPDPRVLPFHKLLPGYAPTPLVDAPALARRLGVERVWVKDESSRLGLPSFKILGASWATYRALCRHRGLDLSAVGDLDTLRGQLGDEGLVLVAATDGNHGRAVAHIAALLGIRAHILVPDDMSAARQDAIRREGAQLTIVGGGYDDAIARSAGLADETHLLISDTSWPGYQEVPGWVIDGYATIGAEVDAQLASRGARPPDMIAVQIGVGALAAAIVRHFGRRPGTVIGVEPTTADCVISSIEAGRILSVPGPHHSIMAGLNCGTPSLVAWPTISRGIHTFLTIQDDAAREAMRMLAEAGIVSGESGAAGLAGLIHHRDRLDLPRDTEVLVISTEGATDPVEYRKIIEGAGKSQAAMKR